MTAVRVSSGIFFFWGGGGEVQQSEDMVCLARLGELRAEIVSPLETIWRLTTQAIVEKSFSDIKHAKAKFLNFNIGRSGTLIFFGGKLPPSPHTE